MTNMKLAANLIAHVAHLVYIDSHKGLSQGYCNKLATEEAIVGSETRRVARAGKMLLIITCGVVTVPVRVTEDEGNETRLLGIKTSIAMAMSCSHLSIDMHVMPRECCRYRSKGYKTTLPPSCIMLMLILSAPLKPAGAQPAP